jgi:hypothetical protein
MVGNVDEAMGLELNHAVLGGRNFTARVFGRSRANRRWIVFSWSGFEGLPIYPAARCSCARWMAKRDGIAKAHGLEGASISQVEASVSAFGSGGDIGFESKLKSAIFSDFRRASGGDDRLWGLEILIGELVAELLSCVLIDSVAHAGLDECEVKLFEAFGISLGDRDAGRQPVCGDLDANSSCGHKMLIGIPRGKSKASP